MGGVIGEKVGMGKDGPELAPPESTNPATGLTVTSAIAMSNAARSAQSLIFITLAPSSGNFQHKFSKKSFPIESHENIIKIKTYQNIKFDQQKFKIKNNSPRHTILAKQRNKIYQPFVLFT